MQTLSFEQHSGLWVPPQLHGEVTAMPLFIPGAGLTPEGELTIPGERRADAVAKLVGLGMTEHVIFSGSHPGGSKYEYATSEARAMWDRAASSLPLHEEVVLPGRYQETQHTYVDTHPLTVVLEEHSTTTWENVIHSRPKIEEALNEAETDKLGLVIGADQLQRATEISRRILGRDVRIIPFVTEQSAPLMARTKELALRGVLASQGRKAIDGDFYTQSFVMERYNRIINLPKRVLRVLFPNY